MSKTDITFDIQRRSMRYPPKRLTFSPLCNDCARAEKEMKDREKRRDEAQMV
jgi:hypothetical protein